jgi:hypothetical protein
MSLAGRRSHQVHEQSHRLGGIADAELRRRDAELSVIRGDAQVAVQGDAEPAADAIAADFRDGRLADGAQKLAEAGGFAVPFRALLRGRATLLESGNVGAGNESLVARPGQHDHADGPVAREILENFSGRDRHLRRHRVAPLRVVEGQGADPVGLARKNLVGAHFSLLLSRTESFPLRGKVGMGVGRRSTHPLPNPPREGEGSHGEAY